MADEILGIPKSVLSTIPLGAPPAGVTPNLVDPVNKGNTLIIVASIFLAIGLTAYAIRVYAKIFVIKKLYWDDLTLTLGMLGILITYAGNILGVVRGTSGLHVWDSSVESALTTSSIVANYLETVFLTPALGFLKLSVLLMLYHIFRPLRWLRISVYLSAFVICGFYGAIAIVLFVRGTPRPGISWQDWAARPEYQSTSKVSIPTGVFGLVTDIFLVLLPVPAVLKLQMPMKRKIGVLLVFMVGLIACVASAVGTYYRVEQIITKDWTWNTVPTESLIQVEMNAGVVCVCMPSISRTFGVIPFFESCKSSISSGIEKLRTKGSFAYFDRSRSDSSFKRSQELTGTKENSQVPAASIQMPEAHFDYRTDPQEVMKRTDISVSEDKAGHQSV